MKDKTSLLLSLHDLKCTLYKGKVIIDKNVRCSIDILRSHSCPIFKARGVIETSIPLPVTSSDLEGYSHFELGFDEPIEGISKILIVITEVNWDNKKRAKFESLSYTS